ncbi:hypothetical protein RB597_010299 [Gaeumannomyces tritici]
MDGRPPIQPDFDKAPQWHWASRKVGLDPKTLFTTLNEQYNKVSCDIQSPEAFHHDVSSIVLQAENLQDFHRRLAARREERLRELQAAWSRVTQNFYCWRPIRRDKEEDQVCSAFGRMVGNMSFESIICYADAHIPDERKYLPALSNLDPGAKPLSPASKPDDGLGQQLQQRREALPPPPVWPPIKRPTWPPRAPSSIPPPENDDNKPPEKTPPPSPLFLLPSADADDDGSGRPTATTTVEFAAASSSSRTPEEPNTEQGEEQQLQRGQSRELDDKENSTELQSPAVLSSSSSSSSPKRRSNPTETLARKAGIGSRSDHRSLIQRRQQHRQQEDDAIEKNTTVAGNDNNSQPRTMSASAMSSRRSSNRESALGTTAQKLTQNAGVGSRSRQHKQQEIGNRKRPRTPESRGNNNRPTRKSRRVAGLPSEL